MCGVVGLVTSSERDDLGRMAATLLKALEYRGYDSTGAVIQGESTDSIVLRKDVGAPSQLVEDLGIVNMGGRLFCGQVRWATFGAVDRINAQPHVVSCRVHMYGAHNGNVTNTEQLRKWLLEEGHDIASDNDGEMLVHTIEHYFSLELMRIDSQEDPEERRAAMRRAIVRAQERVEGSFAAVVVDPISKTAWAIKSGSSLYAGLAEDERGKFNLASSDLSSILKFTRVLVPLSEGEAFEFSDAHYKVFAVKPHGVKVPGRGRVMVEPGDVLERRPVRSRLKAKDTELLPQYEYFMEQEIAAQSDTARAVLVKFTGGAPLTRELAPLFDAHPDWSEEIEALLSPILEATQDYEIRQAFEALAAAPLWNDILEEARPIMPELPVGNEALGSTFSSEESGLLTDLLNYTRSDRERNMVRILDAFLELKEVQESSQIFSKFADLIYDARRAGRHIYMAACGTSYHAAMAACLFFNEIAWTEIIPILPGEFRGRYSHTVKDGDVVVAITQSGETKDLIDILNDIEATGKKVTRVAVVNNVNSTIPQEKSDLVIPLRCGPEIAVPATKSFINQITVLYALALEVARRQIERGGDEWPEDMLRQRREDLDFRLSKLEAIPELIRETVDTTEESVRAAAKDLFLAPSVHILATRINAVAKEGALKIREVVLNHTEGFEGAEFKHGPNTILGINTVMGMKHLDIWLSQFGELMEEAHHLLGERGLGFRSATRVMNALQDLFVGRPRSFALSEDEEQIFETLRERFIPEKGLSLQYPLIYVSGPDDRDVRLAISQINTHKIRGASTVLIAEEDPRLRETVELAPADQPSYWHHYIVLPRTGDTLLTVFSSTVVLQRLALEMSVLKMEYLDRLGVKDHGVHPDVPKNVSKSITVD